VSALSNTKREIFCLEYTADFNGAAAAIRAGYAENGSRVRGNRLLNSPEVQERIQEIIDDRRGELEVTVANVVHRLNETANACLQLVEKRAHGSDTVVLVPINATAGLKALELLGRHLGMFIERTQEIASDACIQVEWSAPIDPRMITHESDTEQ